MDLRGRVRLALSALLVPAWTVHPVAGLVATVGWWLATRAPIVADPRLLTAAIAVAVVLAAHGDPTVTLAGQAAALVVGTLAALALAHGSRGTVAAAAGVGAAAAAAVLAVVAVTDAVRDGFGQVHPGTFHPNLSAGLGLALAGASALARHAPGRWRGWWWVGTASAALMVVLTGSRSGILGVFAATLAGLVLAALHRGARRTALRATLAVAAGVLVLALIQVAAFDPTTVGFARPAHAIATTGTTVDPGAGEGVAARWRSLADPWSAAGAHVANWRVARALAAERPFLGYGFDAAVPTFRDAARATLMVANVHPHNTSLLVLLQGGTVFATALAGVVLAYVWALARRAVSGDRVALHVAAAAFGLLVADRFDLLLADPTIAVVFGLAVVAATGPSPRDAHRPKELA